MFGLRELIRSGAGCWPVQLTTAQEPLSVEILQAYPSSLLILIVVITLVVVGGAILIVWLWFKQTDRGHRREVETTLQEREALYRSLFERASDAIFLSHQDGQLVDVNPRACELLGYSRAELLTMKAADLQAPEVRGQAANLITQELKKNGRCFETVNIDSQGRRIPVEVSASKLSDDGDALILCIVRDITEQKEAQAALQRYAERLQIVSQIDKAILSARSAKETAAAALDNLRALIPYQRANINLFELEANEGFILVEVTGDESDYQEGRRFSLEGYGAVLDYVMENDLQVVTETTLAAIAPEPFSRLQAEGVQSFLGTLLIVHGEIIGSSVFLSNEANAFNTEQHEIICEVGDQIAVAVQNVQLLERFQRVITSISDHIYMTEVTKTGHRQNRYLSPNIEALTGYPPDKFYKSWSFWPGTVIHPDDRAVAQAQLEKLLAGQDSQCQYRLIGTDGSVVWVRDSARAEQVGDSTYIYGIVSDITERRQLEAQLYQAQKMEAIGQLAGGVAHDFNNLLTVVTGVGELALNTHLEDDDDPIAEDLRQIIAAGHRATALTRQLLAFSRKQALQPQVLNLNNVIERTSELLRRLLGEDVQLTTRLDPALGAVTLDPSQVDQIIINLAVNARDAMRYGGQLVIETSNVELDERYAGRHADVTPGSYVMLSASDTGCGMDATTQAQIFEPFFTTKTRGKDTGLGLATVYGIVNQSEGHIWVYSEPEVGTTFKVYFPRTDQAEHPAATKTIQDQPPLGSETILLVEDDPMVQELTQRILRSAGYQVLSARHGQEAIGIVSDTEEEIDLLISDVVLPGGMSGPETAEKLLVMKPTMKILFTSGYTSSTVSLHGVSEQDKLFIEKPYTPKLLCHKVRELLEEKPTMD